MTPRPYLLFVRAGAQSLHPRLIAEDPTRSWDCCVSWYAPHADEHLAEYYCDGGDNKLEGFLEFWKRCGAGPSYRYVWIMDDDVYLRPGEITRFFELCERYSTYLCQPALRWLTNTTLNVLVRNPVCVLRRVSFVEVMAPCFSARALAELIHTFDWTKSTWGTDWAWACLLEGKQALHVIDAVAMEHTRRGDPRRGAFYRKLAAMGVDPAEDLERVERMFPRFAGARTLGGGHRFRRGIPPQLAPVLWRVLERTKLLVRLRKQLIRHWRQGRARIEDLVQGAR